MHLLAWLSAMADEREVNVVHFPVVVVVVVIGLDMRDISIGPPEMTPACSLNGGRCCTEQNRSH